MISEKTRINENKIRDFISKLTENEKGFNMFLPSGKITFPPYLLCESDKSGKISYSSDSTPINKFEKERPSIPLLLTIMITSKCQTDCVYCYADRTRKDDMETDTILKLIDDAWDLGVLWVNVSGGDIFAMNDWNKILKKLHDYNFMPFLSTKVPLQEDDVVFLKEIGVKKIQYSIDSFDEKELLNNVKRGSDYVEKIKNTFNYLQRYGITLGVRSVLTKYNSSVQSISNTLSALEQYSDIIDYWDVTPAFYSAFRGEYGNYRPSDENLSELFDYFSNVKSTIKIGYAGINDKLSYQTTQFESVEKFVCKNKTCIANTYSMFVLSNGEATLCELMYYNEDCYTGNINDKSILEIWNSDRSRKTLNPKQSDIVDQLNPCALCSSFEECKSVIERRVCYVDVINAYGKDKCDYPDPRCPKAPQHNPDLMLY